MHNAKRESKADCEARFPAKLPPKFPHVYEETILAAINEVAGAIPPKTIAREIGKAKDTVYHKLKDETRLFASEYVMIARLGISEGQMEAACLILPPGYSIIATPEIDAFESIESLETDLMASEGEVIEAMRKGQHKKASAAALAAVTTAKKIAEIAKR